jgi:hypothetical protein
MQNEEQVNLHFILHFKFSVLHFNFSFLYLSVLCGLLFNSSFSYVLR